MIHSLGELPNFASRFEEVIKMVSKPIKLAPRARDWKLENSRIP